MKLCAGPSDDLLKIDVRTKIETPRVDRTAPHAARDITEHFRDVGRVELYTPVGQNLTLAFRWRCFCNRLFVRSVHGSRQQNTHESDSCESSQRSGRLIFHSRSGLSQDAETLHDVESERGRRDDQHTGRQKAGFHICQRQSLGIHAKDASHQRGRQQQGRKH